MPLSTKLDRKIRAAADSSDDEEYYEVTDRSSPSVIETGEGAEIISSDEGDDDDNDDDEGADGADGEEQSDDDDDQFQRQLSKVSFGALAKAQDALSKQSATKKRKRGDEPGAPQEDKLQALRERLRQIKAQKLASAEQPSKKPKTAGKERPAHTSTKGEAAQDDGSSDSDGAPRARSSKHAPAVQSSKRAVTRKRAVVEVKKPVARDPRFDNIGGARPDDNTLLKRYAFLEDYKASEMAELRAAIKKTKSEADKDTLKRKLLSMESQKKARDRKEQHQEVAREHKKKEKELVKQGKNPFYLKKSEQKKLTLINQYESLKGKQLDHAIERRRKKATAKERKSMPSERRA
ncbi:DUF947-domain-containing protein [Amniculicola lignicola CBS 123094]|uniref:rRNA biogenesis protein RRP36 n=1 Tax=Amniculicola lignicola CBS 123094 TaxID=1392246 RepID=A0A6A5WSB1_9PLEO|nr:DUF947-domain-containing protein [Amniculicola lignicola CBS 123094]